MNYSVEPNKEYGLSIVSQFSGHKKDLNQYYKFKQLEDKYGQK